MFRTKTLAAAILTLSLISGLRAQTPPDANPPEKAQTQSATGVLTDASLKQMLEKLGYEAREEKTKDGTLYWIDITAEGLKYNVSVQISPNKEKIWTIVPLADITEEHQKMADRWMKLTELNDQIGPCYFRYNVQYKRLYMTRPMDNRGMTAKLLRDHLERQMDRCVETKLHWMTTGWAEKPVEKTSLNK